MITVRATVFALVLFAGTTLFASDTYAVPVNGVCGSAHGSTLTTKPTTNLCSVGTASTVSGTGPWTWQCIGLNGGTTAYCSTKLQSSTIDTTPPTSSNCINTLTSTTAIPTGFGASYNMLSSTKELLVSGTCSDSTATVTVGSAGTSIYVYTKGYYNSGGSWIPFTLTCADGQMHSSTWCKGQGSVTVPFIGTALNVVGYTCQSINNTWKCGCRDTSCTTRLWQMQSIQRSTGVPPKPGTTIPTTTLSASPTTISSGQSTKLTWTSTNATSCMLSPYTSTITTSGSVTLSPTVTTTYKLACTGSGGTVSKSVTVTVGAVSTTGRVLHTNFGPGVSLTFVKHYGYDRTTLEPFITNYAAGDEFALTGTDQSTGYVFGPNAPQIWGGKPADRAYAGQFQKGSSIKYRVVENGLPFKAPSQVHTLELLSNIPGPTGTPTYVLHHAYKEPYFLPDQSPYKIHTDTNLPQGMYYLRYWFKLLPGFVSQWGTGWRWFGLTENKSVADNNRAGVGLRLENGQACLGMTIDSMKGGIFKGTTIPAWYHLYPRQAGPCLKEDTWYKLEFATRPANSDTGGGFVWAALDGKQFAYQAGQNIFDGDVPKYWGIFLTMFYGNTANPGVGTYTTGMELWDRWPADASPHPFTGL